MKNQDPKANLLINHTNPSAGSTNNPAESETLTVTEYIEMGIGLLEKAESLRLNAQQKMWNGENCGDATELNLLKRQFDSFARPMVQVANALYIDATPLDDFIRTGRSELVSNAIRVLRQIQAEALRYQAGLDKKPQISRTSQGNSTEEKAQEDALKVQPLADETALSATELATHYGVGQEVLRKRLERLRKQDFNSFIEAADPEHRKPRFLYKVGKVKTVIEAIKTSSKASVKRPSKKN